MLTNALSPYPVTITQKEKQLVLFKGNHYFYSPYRVIKQTTNVNVGTRNVESYSKLNPVTQTDVGFAYGPYLEQKPFAEVSVLLSFHGTITILLNTSFSYIRNRY